MPITGHRAHRRRLHQGRRAAHGPAPLRPGSAQWIADATPDSGPLRADSPGKHRGGARARLYGLGGCLGSPAVEKITEQTFGPLKALCEKTTEEASCIVNPLPHPSSHRRQPYPCLPRCSDIYVSGVMETENCSRRSALKTMLAGTAAGLLHTKEPHHDLIRLDSEYQTIENFSASDCWSMQKLGTWSLPNRNRVAD